MDNAELKIISWRFYGRTEQTHEHSPKPGRHDYEGEAKGLLLLLLLLLL